MANDYHNIAMIGDTFIKVKPTDNTELIKETTKELKELKRKFEKLNSKVNLEKVSKTSDIEKLIELEDEIRMKSSALLMPKIDVGGMDHFWSLSQYGEMFCLTQVPNQKGDEISQKFFPSMNLIYREFRNLRDIFSNEESFIGKKVYFHDDIVVYVVFEFEEGFIGHLLKNGAPCGPIIGFSKPKEYSDESMIELDDPELFYNYIKILKRRGQ